MKKPDKLKMDFTIIDETVLPLSSFGQILVETSDEDLILKIKCSKIHSMLEIRQKEDYLI